MISNRVIGLIGLTPLDLTQLTAGVYPNSVPLTVRLVEEYNKGLESRYIEYPTRLLHPRHLEIITLT
ncbi:hypothetical protein BpHYR1_034569 [Brachionus plicatilis]|uniref:Uncharacterized protein n=1 Tax=Brachionus plicatilis TaxID=10195 RepID=A0A3M7PWW5_BRAPC|nr:hypothetical protein BpHYR1_034569 [Brachionus plicatilis]